MRNVYLDYSATTPVKDEVFKEMIPYFTEKFGNPSSLYDKGLEAKDAVTHAREQVAALINAEPREVFFTAGGTEADNWAVFGVCDKLKDKGNHIITTKIEHHAMLHSCAFLEKQGYEVTYLDIDKDGRVDLEQLKNSITDKTILISVMMINNEIGTLQPIKEIAEIAKELNEKMQSAELRRVVYVALTRAKTELFITNPKYETPKDFLQANKFLPGQESNPSSFFDVLEPIYNQFASREDENQNELIPFDVEIIEPIPRNAPSKTQKRINNYESKRNLLLYIQKEKLYENVEIYQTEYPEPIYTNPSHLSKDDDEIFSNFQIVENAPYQRINQIVLESVPPQIENAQNESEAEPAFSFANFGTIAHAYLESVISGKKPEEHYSVKEFIGLENKTEKIQEIKKICEEMKNAFENSDLGKRAKNSTKHFAELSFRSKLSSKIVKGIIDLIFEDSDGTFTVVDYKTNQTVVPEIYYAQLKCYKDAVCQIFGKSKNEVKCVLYYLRYAKAVDITEECDKINLKEF